MCWDFLEISPTVDKKQIKSAYLKGLKKYHPEDDPENFKKLRAAYEAALVLATQELVTHSRLETHILKQSIRDLYGDLKHRNQVEAWQNIWSHPDLLHSDIKEDVSLWCFHFIGQHIYLSAAVLQNIEAYFSWRENYTHLCQIFDQEKVEKLLDYIIYSPWGLEIETVIFQSGTDIDAVEQYFVQRSDLFDLINARQYCDIAGLLDAMLKNVVDPEYWRLLALAYDEQGLSDRALACKLKLANAAPDKIDGYLQLGLHYSRIGESMKAIACFDRVLEIDSTQIHALKGIAACYHALGDSIQAKTLYSESLKHTEYDLESYIQLIQISKELIDRNFDRLNKDNTAFKYYEQMVACYFDIGDNQSCIEITGHMWRHADRNSHSLYRFWMMGLTGALWRALFAPYSDFDVPYLSIELYLLRARACRNLRLHEEALNAYDRVNMMTWISTNHNNLCFEACLELGEIFVIEDQHNDAIAYLEKANIIHPHHHRVLGELAYCYYRTDEYLKAEILIKEAIELNSRQGEYSFTSAFVNMALLQYEAALVDWDRLIECWSESASVNPLYQKGICLNHLERYQDAIICLEASIEHHALSISSLEALLKAFLATGNQLDGLKWIDIFVKQGGDLSNLHELCARIDALGEQ